jgi:hydrogenase maturation protease
MTEANRAIVLGLGNTLNRDEGLGVHALKALEAHLGARSDSLELLDGGVLGLNLLPLVEECSHLLVLDAIDARKAPGTVIELAKEQIPLYAGVKLSQHQITFQEVLGLANIRRMLPQHLHMIGIQPEDISIGLEMSLTVEQAISAVVYRACLVLNDWGLMDNTGK